MSSSVAVDRRPFPSLPLPRGPIAVTACLLSALAAVWTRMDAPLPFPTFQGACERLRASGLPASPRDWWCQPAPWTLRGSFLLALLLAAVGIVLPGVILAAGGRRWSSLPPLLAAPWVRIPGLYGGGGWWQAGSTGASTLISSLANATVLSAPILAVWLVVPRRALPREPIARSALLLTTTICGVATYGLVILARSIEARHFAEVGGPVAISDLLPAVTAIGLLGIVLGTERRWWPWSLVPVALFLSAGPSVAVLRGPEPFNDWSRFGAVMPLFLVGLTWSLWKPITARISAAITHRAHAQRERVALRWSAELNAGAIVVIAASLIMFRADPLPTQIGSVLPTYLGARIQADDVRTKLNLRQAIADMDAFAKAHGTYRGFDAAVGTHVDPSLAWADGAAHLQPLTVSIDHASASGVRVAALSSSGNAFCLQRSGALTFGISESGFDHPAALSDAIAKCGSTAWSPSAVSTLDVATMCDNVDTSQYLLCRMVQVLIHNTLQESKPN